MRRSFLFLIFSIICFTSLETIYANEENLIANPGFEDKLSNWEKIYGDPAQISESIQHSGNYSLGKTVRTSQYWSQTSQDVALKAGEPAYAKIYIKTTFSPESTACAGLMLQFMDNNGNILSDSNKGEDIGGNTDSWRLVEVNYKSAPSGTTKIRLSAYTAAGETDDSGSAYFDDVSLIKKYQQYSLGSALLNPGFENELDGWQDHGAPSVVLSSDIKNKGNYAAQKTINRVGGDDFWREISQTISCSPSKRVTARMYIKTVFASNAKARGGIRIECLDLNDTLLTETHVSTKGKNWVQLACKIAKTPKNTAKLKFIGYIYAPAGDSASDGGKVYFDDAAIEIK